MTDVMKGLNDSTFDAPFESVPALFLRQAELYPEKTAVVSSEASFTYRELNEASNRIANYLIHEGIKADDTVMILLQRSCLVYAANIGILKAGAAFVYAPLSYPDGRIGYIYKDAGCRYIIASKDTDPARIDSVFGRDSRLLYIEDLLRYRDASDPEVRISPHDLAYCIYTSGSTGKPKGVMIEEDNLFNFLHHNPKNTETVSIAENSDVLLSLAALTFDVSIMEEFIPLTSGKTVAMASDTELLNPDLLKEFIIRSKVDGICITPSFLDTLISLPSMKEALRNIRVYDIGAEAFPAGLYDRVKKVSPDAVIQNGYGPTEATISCTVKILEGGEGITIGNPNANVYCYIVDKDNNELRAGETGELLIAGRGVGRGYKNLPEKTEEAFISFKGMRAYKTGDLARITDSGEIEFHGRLDNQVKLRGLRIELGEVEEVMSGFKSIRNCAAAVIDSRMLCLYYVPRGNATKEAVAEYAASHLAHYMVPDLYMELKEMPMTANMKVDRKALPKPETVTIRHEEPSTDIERRLLEIITPILAGRDIGIETDLSEVGTTSLEYMMILAAVGDEFSVSITFQEVVNTASLKELSRIIGLSPGLTKKKRLLSYPATFAQYKYYEGWKSFNNEEQMIPVLMEIPEDADLTRFKAAVKEAFFNHPGIFIRFEYDSEKDELLQIPPDEDIEGIPLFGEDIVFDEKDFDSLKYSLSMKLIDPGTYPYFRLNILRSGNKRFLYMNFAHVISDADSVELLIEDIGRSYSGLTLKPEAITVYELAYEQNELLSSERYSEITDYYEKAFKGLKSCARLPEEETGLSAAYDYLWESLCESPERIRETVKAFSTTESTLFVTITAIFMSAYSSGGFGTFMMAHNGRNDSRLSHTFGFIASEMPLCIKINENERFRDLLIRVKGCMVEGMMRPLLSFDWLMERYPECLDYLFIYQEEEKSIQLDGTDIETLWLEDVISPEGYGTAYGDGDKAQGEPHEETEAPETAEKLTIVIHPGKDSYGLELHYLVNLFSRDTVKAMHEYLNGMLKRLCAAEDENITVGEIMGQQEAVPRK